jgi:hypothetical protein
MQIESKKTFTANFLTNRAAQRKPATFYPFSIYRQIKFNGEKIV